MQLLLPVTLNSSQTFASFVECNNNQGVLLHELQRAIQSNEFDSFFLYGSEQTGKTHLLTACCNLANEFGKTSILLPLEQLVGNSEELIQGLENVDVICIDNIHKVAGIKHWQTAIFNLFNASLNSNKTFIFTANNIAAELNIELPDLVSRLQWGTSFRLQPLSENEKALALTQHAHLMGFELTSEVAKFMLNRLPRNMSLLMQALDLLAKQSIEKQRKVTVPFVKDVLEI